jgi:hypothetical protein
MEQVRCALEMWSVCREKGINNGMDLIDALESSTASAGAASGGAAAAAAAAVTGVTPTAMPAAAGHAEVYSGVCSVSQLHQQHQLDRALVQTTMADIQKDGMQATAAAAGIAVATAAAGVAASSGQPPNTGSGFERVQALQVELERNKLEKGKLLKELQAQRMLKDR